MVYTYSVRSYFGIHCPGGFDFVRMSGSYLYIQKNTGMFSDLHFFTGLYFDIQCSREPDFDGIVRTYFGIKNIMTM